MDVELYELVLYERNVVKIGAPNLIRIKTSMKSPKIYVKHTVKIVNLR